MCTRATEKTLPDKSFTEQELNILFCPLLRWQGLQEHEHFLKIHFYKLVRPLYQKCGANIEVKLREALVF